MIPSSYLTNLLVREAWRHRHRKAFAHATAPGRPRLLLDVSNIIRHDARTGIQRVVRAIWLALERESVGRFELVPVFAGHRHGYCVASSDVLDGRLFAGPTIPVTVQANDVFLGLDLAAQFVPKYAEQLLAWQRSGVSLNFVVYDLLPLTNPQWFNARTSAHFNKWFNFLENHADQAICISDDVAQLVKSHVSHPTRSTPLRVMPIRMGADLEDSLPSVGVSDEAARAMRELRDTSIILMVGTVEPRKSYDVALAAFEQIWRQEDSKISLVIVGKYGWKADQLRDRILRHREHGKMLRWLRDVSDESLSKLYAGCAGVLVTSQSEGFGLPVIEALAHEKPVLARDLPVFREKDSENITYIADDSPKSLASQIVTFASSEFRAISGASRLPTWLDSAKDILSALPMLNGPQEMSYGHEAIGRKSTSIC